MKTIVPQSACVTVAATLSAEDVDAGDFVAVLNITLEVPSYLWEASSALRPAEELVRLRMIPSDAGVPLKVFAVCLPFVYAKNAGGKLETLDVRKHQLVRLDRRAAKEVWNALKGHSNSACSV